MEVPCLIDLIGGRDVLLLDTGEKAEAAVLVDDPARVGEGSVVVAGEALGEREVRSRIVELVGEEAGVELLRVLGPVEGTVTRIDRHRDASRIGESRGR